MVDCKTVLNNQHLTSVEILNEAKSIPHILTLYSILDELRNMGMIQSYMKQNLRYHVAIE